jgi:hypothetical protein
LSEAQFAEIIMTIIAIPLIMFIVFYLLACSIAPLVDLNNQTFKIIFTLAAGVPTLLFLFKKSD